MQIKTFPLQFTEERLEEIRAYAKANGMTLKEFFYMIIDNYISMNDR